jgi:dynein heavy chain
MVRGTPPREASDRLTIFQAKFDELWRKFETYSAGEDLFGLSITEYPDLQRIKRVKILFIWFFMLFNYFFLGIRFITKTLWFI